jgi:hypothetical protein
MQTSYDGNLLETNTCRLADLFTRQAITETIALATTSSDNGIAPDGESTCVTKLLQIS